MFSIAYTRPLATLAIAGGLLIAAAPASAKCESPKDQLSGIHAVSDGTSNTVFLAAVAAPTPNGYSFGATRGSHVMGTPTPANVACDGIGA